MDKPRKIKHSDLKRWSESDYKSECPDCDLGILLVRRNADYKLSRFDNCIVCGKAFLYTDDNICVLVPKVDCYENS
ncbi:hypothetical protein M0R72_00460 [Candidatus Pacearchaeota archaeon]|nr:hypothetical protein [Candidatus Pacearchaeota archaeon]